MFTYLHFPVYIYLSTFSHLYSSVYSFCQFSLFLSTYFANVHLFYLFVLRAFTFSIYSFFCQYSSFFSFILTLFTFSTYLPFHFSSFHYTFPMYVFSVYVFSQFSFLSKPKKVFSFIYSFIYVFNSPHIHLLAFSLITIPLFINLPLSPSLQKICL